MSTVPPKKKRKVIRKFDDNEILTILAIFKSIETIPFYVCEAYQEKITKNLIKFLMGNNVVITSDQDAIDFLFKRDHGDFLLLLVGKFGPRFMPQVFFTQVPSVLIPEDFEDKFQKALQVTPTTSSTYQLSESAQNSKWQIKDGVAVPKNHLDGGLQGDVVERKVFVALKKHFVQDDCLVLHSHSFLHNSNFKEKDFIILNLTKGYVTAIEAKASLKYINSAKD